MIAKNRPGRDLNAAQKALSINAKYAVKKTVRNVSIASKFYTYN